jgi:hypothetical protein
MYHTDGLYFNHLCRKSRERREESMPRNADFFDHFRAFFDARADQRACKHYIERPIADDKTIALLQGMAAKNGHGEFGFFSDENRLAEKLDDKFIRCDMHAIRAAPGNRVFYLLPLGEAEVKRVDTAAQAKGGE